MRRRREFISLLCGATAAWPLAVRAQQSERVRRLGVLMPVAENDPVAEPWITALQERLQKLGWQVGRNLRVDYRWTAGNFERMPALAAELVSLYPDVLLAGNGPTAAALQRSTRSIPIVFLLAPPLDMGLVTSLAHPDGNMTGFSGTEPEQVQVGKQLELLKEIAPAIRRVGFIFNPADGSYVAQQLRVAEASAPSLGLEIVPLQIQNATEIESTITAWQREVSPGLFVVAGITTLVNRQLIASLAAQHLLPAIYGFRFFITAGGLASYGPDITEAYRQGAQYIDKILKGAKVSDLPVQNATKYELVINLRAAKAIGLEISPVLLNRADEVIE
jgi:putative tryptophan/tyrosine transport system substrate-binding protein